jgi:adenylylsulfate kinase
MKMAKKNISRARHIAKTITWRIVGTIDTILLGWLITGDPLTGIKIGSVELITKMLLYYAHERLWYKSKFGIQK